MWTRRDTLKALAACGGAAALPLGYARTAAVMPPDLEVQLTAEPARARIWQGAATDVLHFTGEVLRGRGEALQPSGSYLGPTLDLVRGERVRIRFRNRTGEPSIVHWHGMLVPDEADRHPRHAVPSGGEYIYEFTVRNPAGTYLYHPHPHGRTGSQVYRGLAGLVIVREADERTRGLPQRDQELTLVIQDRRAGRDNQLAFPRDMMARMSGVLGDRVLTNGQADGAFDVTRAAWRLRIANVSNARIYKLAWSDGRPIRVIATDNGLVSSSAAQVERPYVALAPFERVEILEDFGARAPGAEIALETHEFSSLLMMGGMMGRRMDGGVMGDGAMGPAQGEKMHIATFRVARGPRERAAGLALPQATMTADKPATELHTQLAFRHMRGFMNGREFEMAAVAGDEHLPVGRATVWTFANDGPGMPMPHPMHIHGVRFRVLDRSGRAAPSDLREGLVDAGFKDTFLIFPGERVRVHVVPTEPGLFMYHCHNLEHEDGGMMRNCSFDA